MSSTVIYTLQLADCVYSWARIHFSRLLMVWYIIIYIKMKIGLQNGIVVLDGDSGLLSLSLMEFHMFYIKLDQQKDFIM